MSEPVSAPTVTLPRLDVALRSLIAPLVAYVITLATAGVLTVLIVAAFALESDGASMSEEVGGDIDVQAIGNLIGMPFQLSAMGLFGSLGLGGGDFSVSLFAPPLLLTSVFAVATFVVARRLERSTPTTNASERVVLGIVSGVVAAIVISLATRLLAMRDEGESMHATSVGLFLGALTITAVASHLGRQSIRGSVWPGWLPRELRVAAHLVTQHLLLWVVALLPVVTVWALVEDGPGTALFLLVWGPTLALHAYSMGHLGGSSTFGETAFAWDLGVVSCILVILLAVSLAVVTTVAWSLRRDQTATWQAMPLSWLALPGAFAGAGFVVWILATVRVSGELFDVSGGLALQPVGWLLLVMTVWGAAMELASRTVAPVVAGKLPERVARRLAVAPVAQPTSTAPVADGVPMPARAPMTPEERRRVKRVGISIGVVGGIVLVGWIAVRIIGSQMYGPEKDAEAYLDAIVAEDVEKALELAPVDDESESDLLTSAVYRETGNRITGYDVTDVDRDGGVAKVKVKLEGISGDNDVELVLRTDGRTAVFFDKWIVDEGGLAQQLSISVPEDTTELGVNGVKIAVDAGDDTAFWALPGAYAFDPYIGNPWVKTSGEETVVSTSGDDWGYVELPEPAPSDELLAAVDSELKTWIDTCMKATELDPEGCPQSAYAFGEKPRKVTWRLTTLPTINFDYFDGTFPAELSSGASGEATVTFEADQSYGFGAPQWVAGNESSSFSVNATVDLEGDELTVSFDSY